MLRIITLNRFQHLMRRHSGMAVAADHVGHRCAPGFMRIKKKRLAVNPLMLNDLARNQNRILLIFLQRLPSQALHFIAGHFPPAPFNDFLGSC